MLRKHETDLDSRVQRSTALRAHVLVAVVSSMAAVVIAACGAADEGEALDATEGVEMVAEAIGEAPCARATADMTLTPRGTYTRAAPYSNPRCSNAVVVDILNYQSSVGPYAPVMTHVHSWANAPTTQASCAAATLRADLYRRDSGVWNLIASDTVPGYWASWSSSPWCTLGRVDEDSRMVSGNDYRIAASMMLSPTVQGEVSVFSASSYSGEPEEPPPWEP